MVYQQGFGLWTEFGPKPLVSVYKYYRNFTFVADLCRIFSKLRIGIGAIQDMLGTAEDEISSNLQEFQGVIKISKKFFVLGNGDFRDFQFWRREPPYLTPPLMSGACRKKYERS